MRPKSLALLLLALGCGLVASAGITRVMAKRDVKPESLPGDSQAIFVAMADVGMGDLLTSQVLKLEQWPKDKIPPGAISRIEDIEGRRTRSRLYAGEPVLENKLLGKGASQQGATALIPKGYRVVPVKVDLVSGGSSLILPGDRVDVMVHLVRDPARDIPETVTRTILQDVKVFAVNDVLDLEKDKDGGKSIIAKTISLLVTPEQAATITLATQLGSVNLVMRSPEDDLQAPNSQARPSELFGLAGKSEREKEKLQAPPEPKPVEKAPVAAAPRGSWTMRILKPGTVDEVSFEAEDLNAASASALGQWRTTTTTTTTTAAPTAGQAVKEEPKADAAPAQKQTPPPAAPPQPPKQPPKTDRSV
jgi:pilus assembly protein CpaB